MPLNFDSLNIVGELRNKMEAFMAEFSKVKNLNIEDDDLRQIIETLGRELDTLTGLKHEIWTAVQAASNEVGQFKYEGLSSGSRISGNLCTHLHPYYRSAFDSLSVFDRIYDRLNHLGQERERERSKLVGKHEAKIRQYEADLRKLEQDQRALDAQMKALEQVFSQKYKIRKETRETYDDFLGRLQSRWLTSDPFEILRDKYARLNTQIKQNIEEQTSIRAWQETNRMDKWEREILPGKLERRENQIKSDLGGALREFRNSEKNLRAFAELLNSPTLGLN